MNPIIVLFCDEATGTVMHCSDNADDFFDVSPTKLLGIHFHTIFDSHIRHEINNVLGASIALNRRVRVTNSCVRGVTFRISLCRLEAHFIIEIERLNAPPDDVDNLLQEVHDLLFMTSQLETASETIHTALQGLRRLCGVDRAAFMEFKEDGTIVLKDSVHGPFLPTLTQEVLSDFTMSKEKRRRLQHLRVGFVNDFAREPIKLLSYGEVSEAPDLSFTIGQGYSCLTSKAVKTQSVRASVTFALCVGKQLWGVIECHHSEPLSLSPVMRDILLLFIENLALQLEVRGEVK